MDHPKEVAASTHSKLTRSIGFTQSIGTIQSYLAQNQLKDYSTPDVGWITGLYTFLGLFFGVQASPLIDMYGPRPLAPIATALTVGLYFLLAGCKLYWQFMLCLGVLGGPQAALAGTLGIACIGKLFVQRKGLAIGVALSRSSLGGVIFPLMLRELLGWTWAIRALAFLTTGLSMTGAICLLPFPRLHSPSAAVVTEKKKKYAAISFDAFRSGSFSFLTAGMVFLEFAIFGISGLLLTFAVGAGFAPDADYTRITILNGCSCLGHILLGVVGDQFGHFDVIIAMTIATAVVTGALFVPFTTSSMSVLYAFATLWGFGSGSWLSIMPVCVGKTCDPKEYGRCYGTYSSVVSSKETPISVTSTMNWAVSFAALLAIPVDGELLEAISPAASSGLYLAVVVLGSTCFFVTRGLVSGNMLVFRAHM
ncbi:MFS general substrate transporter [Dothidotthia symphoricarpi CBS 119687]|uniref:MFS general substrate transporter n=1 Tax=Dothidotthia symphoricarpi CBS 119687 TaxID=1392245 RepID=A0A6A6AGR4_9PLEO|nr:MFS general substrate transporter [Dothidotthia symphoricarpi CBS 119687]KAF2130305.1 MFS general substrate transporter [Dothidotthia symphoricarpi CBS 119687]